LLDKAQQQIERALTINPGNSLARYRLGVIDLGVINMCRAKYQEAFQIFNSTPFDKNPNLDVFHIERSSTAGNGNGTSGLVEQFFKNNPEDEGGVVNLRGTGLIRSHAVKRSNENTGLLSQWYYE
jgi:hypothetical protein